MYELTYIINANLSEPEVAAQTDKVRGFINGLAGEIKNEKINEKRKLAYTIKKQNLGFYVTLEFNLEPEKIIELDKQIKLEQFVLRHLILAKEEIKRIPKPIRPIKPKVMPVTKVAPEGKPEKVKIEELEKKLEEILEK